MAAALTDYALKLALKGIVAAGPAVILRLVTGTFPVGDDLLDVTKYTAPTFTGYAEQTPTYTAPAEDDPGIMLADTIGATWVNPDSPGANDIIGWMACQFDGTDYHVLAYEEYAEPFVWSYAGQSYNLDLDWTAQRD